MDVLGIEGVQRIGHTERLCAEQWTDESPIVSPAVINNWSDFCYKINIMLNMFSTTNKEERLAPPVYIIFLIF